MSTRRGSPTPVGRSVPLQDTTDTISSNSVGDAVNELRLEGTRFKVNQTAHTFVLPTYGIIPVVYDNVAGEYIRANGNALKTAADAVVVEVIDADNFVLQTKGFINVPAHGLQVGKWHVLRAGFAGLILPLDTHTDEKVQHICFPVDPNIIRIDLREMFVRDVEGPDISTLENWQEGVVVPRTAGTNRMLQINISWEDNVSNGITSVSFGGVNATLIVEQTITSGFANGSHSFCWLESEIAAFVGTTLTVNWTAGAPDAFGFATALFENVNQTTPIVDTNTDSGTGTPDTLTADINSEDGGHATIVSSCGNAGVTFTNNGTGWTRQVDLTITSADAVVDEKFTTTGQTPETVSMTVTGGNRQVLIASSMRKA